MDQAQCQTIRLRLLKIRRTGTSDGAEGVDLDGLGPSGEGTVRGGLLQSPETDATVVLKPEFGPQVSREADRPRQRPWREYRQNRFETVFPARPEAFEAPSRPTNTLL